MEPYEQRQSAFERLGTFFLIWMGCFLLFNLLSAGLILLTLGKEAYTSMSSATLIAEENLALVKILQMVLSIGMFGVPPVIFIFLSKPRDWAFLKLKQAPSAGLSILTIGIIILAAPLIAWALELNQKMELPSSLENYFRDLQLSQEKLLEALLAMRGVGDFAVNFLMIAVIPAVVEELLFRGVLQQLLEKSLQNIHVAVLLTGSFFSLIHFEFYGFFPRFIMGILLGYMFYWSRNLWLVILGHFIFNGLQLLLLYLYQLGRISYDINQMTAFPPLVTMISTLLLIGVVYLFDRAARQTAN